MESSAVAPSLQSKYLIFQNCYGVAFWWPSGAQRGSLAQTPVRNFTVQKRPKTREHNLPGPRTLRSQKDPQKNKMGCNFPQRQLCTMGRHASQVLHCSL